jgi:hypothetical protein
MTDDFDNDEVWIRDGETWFVDARALCKRLGGDYLTQTEGGDLFIGIPGKGELALATVLAEEKGANAPAAYRSGTVVPIKPK